MNPNKMTNNRDKFHRDPSLNASFTKIDDEAVAGEEKSTEKKSEQKSDSVKLSPGAEAVEMLKAKASKLSGGRMDNMIHNLEGKFTELRSQAKTGLHMVGDILENVGDQLSEKGYKKAGEIVHTAGDKIEHILH